MSPGTSLRRSQSASGQRPADALSQDLFRTGEVVEIVGVSRRQLQYWAQTDLVHPSARTKGGHHRYTFEDLVALKAAKRLIDAGVSVQRIRKSIVQLMRVLPTVRREGTVFEALSGQEWVLEVAAFEREVESWRRASGARRAKASRPSASRAEHSA
jgi:DNA-binding transcriptional MerR regulator